MTLTPQGSDHNHNEANPDVSGPSDKRARDHDHVEQPVVAKKQKLDPVAARRRFVLLIFSNSFLSSYYFSRRQLIFLNVHRFFGFICFSSEVTAGGAKKTADTPCRSSERLKKGVGCC